ncbi:xyloside xylosyltransferase 1 isoform X1 [Candoia aspera]|uniref:xyloside xylosyltransferase 1 isoform X1 n=1 Tax=Candoia aspera TaxID=51853 RepID=UPI002FD84906
MARRLAAAVVRPQPCALAAAAAMALACALYYTGSGSGAGEPASPPPPPGPGAESKAKAGEELLRQAPEGEAELHMLVVLAKAERNEALRAKAAAALRSLVRFGKLGPQQALALHLLCDAPSRAPAKLLFHDALRRAAFRWSSMTWKCWPRGCFPPWRQCRSFSAQGPAATTATLFSSSLLPCTTSCPKRFRGSYKWTWMWSTGPISGNCFRNLTISLKEPLSALPEKCSQSIGTSSGSIGRSIPGPGWESRLLMGCLGSTVGCCCWTWRPCASQRFTTICWNRQWCSGWPASSTSGATWATRTSSPLWAWSTPSCSTSWTVPGTASSVPGGATTATPMSSSSTSGVTATSGSTTATATRLSRRSSCCSGGGGGAAHRTWGQRQVHARRPET